MSGDECTVDLSFGIDDTDDRSGSDVLCLCWCTEHEDWCWFWLDHWDYVEAGGA